MKALNKFLSLILSCAMVMSLCIPAFASERMSSEELDTPFIMDIDNGKLFSAESDDKIVAILTNDDLHLIDISISYSPARDEVYHWAISDYPDDEFSYNDSFWTAIITYAENHLEDSNLVLFTTTVYDAPDSSIDMCASANGDLRDQLIDISISYDPACDEVYHWAISDYPVDEFSYSDSFWNSVIAYAENHFEDSDLVLFTTTIYDTSDSSVDASLSSESNLR